MPDRSRRCKWGLVFWMIAILLAAGCAKVGPNYVRPETKLEPAWQEAGDQRVSSSPGEYRTW